VLRAADRAVAAQAALHVDADGQVIAGSDDPIVDARGRRRRLATPQAAPQRAELKAVPPHLQTTLVV